MAQKCDELWKGIEWNWYTKGGQKVLYWHWSPEYAWEMNFPLQGYNECLITYILAASSPTHSIDAESVLQRLDKKRNLYNWIKQNTDCLYVKHNDSEEYGWSFVLGTLFLYWFRP